MADPKVEDQKKFAEKYTAKEWALLCENKHFMKLVMEDLKAAQEHANIIVPKVFVPPKKKARKKKGDDETPALT